MLIDLLYIDAGSTGVDSFNVLPDGYEVIVCELVFAVTGVMTVLDT